MNNEEKFKKELSDLLGQQDFPFDSVNWSKASHLIDKDRRKNRRVPFIIGGIILLSFSSPFIYELALPEQKPVAENLTISRQHEKQKNEVRNLLQENTDEVVSFSTPTEKGVQAPKTVNQPQSSIAANPAQTSVGEFSKTQAGSGSQEIKTSEPIIEISNDTDPVTPVLETEQVTDIEKTLQVPVAVIKNEELSFEQPAKPTGDQDPSKQETLVETKSDQPAVLTKENAGSAHNNSAKEEATIDNSNIAQHETTATILEDSVQNEIAHRSENKGPATIDTTSISSQTEENSAVIGLALRNTIVSFEAGGDYQMGWMNETGREGSGLAPVFGIHFYTQATSKWLLSSGLQINTVQGLGFSQKIAKTTIIKFGEESDVTKITPNAAYYLVLPLKLHYVLSDKTAISLGCHVNYLITTKSRVETYYEKAGVQQDHSSYTAYGYTQGFRQWSSQVSLGYRYLFYKKLSAGAEIFYGLTDIKENSFFHVPVYERNSGIRLVLAYNLFTK
jgi:hypothetical protein